MRHYKEKKKKQLSFICNTMHLVTGEIPFATFTVNVSTQCSADQFLVQGAPG